MTMPLFWRLILGYAAILLLSIGASIYAVVQLGDLNHTARTALQTDYRTIAQQESLTDAFLSEVRYGGKFLLTQAPASYDQFRQFKNDFIRYLTDLKASGTTADTSTQLVRIEHLHQSFHDLFEQEARHIKLGQPYAQSRYQQERTRILDTSLREMARLKDHLEKSLHDKLEGLSGTARAARNIAIVTTLILIILGAGVSIKISSSVTRPLVELAAKSKIGLQNGSAPALFSTIPEIQELSEVLPRQQQRLLQAAQHNADAIERLSEELATRLAVFKRNLNELKTQNGLLAGQPDHAVMDSMIEDTERLIQHCAEVSASVAARTALSKLEPQSIQSADTINAPFANIESPARELPDPVRATQYPSVAGLANYANRLTSLWRQFKRPPSNAA